MKSSSRVQAVLIMAALAVAVGFAEVRGQTIEAQPGQPDYSLVKGVELVSPRIDGPQALVLFTDRGKLYPAAGAYVSDDRKALLVKDGRIVSFSDPTSELGRFEVASVDQVMLRHAAPARLVLKDSRGRTVPLPDGRFTSREGMTLLIREGTIVGYGKR